MLPATVNFDPGFVVPMPRFPFVSITSKIVPALFLISKKLPAAVPNCLKLRLAILVLYVNAFNFAVYWVISTPVLVYPTPKFDVSLAAIVSNLFEPLPEIASNPAYPAVPVWYLNIPSVVLPIASVAPSQVCRFPEELYPKYIPTPFATSVPPEYPVPVTRIPVLFVELWATSSNPPGLVVPIPTFPVSPLITSGVVVDPVNLWNAKSPPAAAEGIFPMAHLLFDAW